MFKNIYFLYFLVMINTVNLSAQEVNPIRTELIQLKISKTEGKDLKAMKIKFVSRSVDSTALALITKAELSLIKERGYNFKHLMHNKNELDLFKRALYGKAMKLDPIYHTYTEIINEVDALTKKYPGLIQSQKIGVTNQLKRDIYAVKISDNVSQEEDEPAILFSGAIHSNELAGVEICMALIKHLLAHYDDDDQVSGWVNNNEIWVIPVINVDGHHVVTENIDPRWRKNLRDNNENGILYEKCDGIDLNRNFDFNWAHGGSGDSTSERYRGEFPFSENEAIAVRDLALTQKFMLAVTYHSQGEVVFYPWVWYERKSPDDKLLTNIANGLAGSIQSLTGDSTYKAFYGAGTVGQTYPWLYGKLGTFDFIVETGLGKYIFPPAELKKIVTGNLQGAFFMLNQMKGPGLTVLVHDAATGKPLVAEVWLPDTETEDVQRRTTNQTFGRYYRLLTPGKYRIIVNKDGYESQVVKNVQITEQGWTEVNINLRKK